MGYSKHFVQIVFKIAVHFAKQSVTCSWTRSGSMSPCWSLLNFWKICRFQQMDFDNCTFDIIRTWILQATQAVEIDQKWCSSKFIFPYPFFKNQVQINRRVLAWQSAALSVFQRAILQKFFKCCWLTITKMF